MYPPKIKEALSSYKRFKLKPNYHESIKKLRALPQDKQSSLYNIFQCFMPNPPDHNDKAYKVYIATLEAIRKEICGMTNIEVKKEYGPSSYVWMGHELIELSSFESMLRELNSNKILTEHNFILVTGVMAIGRIRNPEHYDVAGIRKIFNPENRVAIEMLARPTYRFYEVFFEWANKKILTPEDIAIVAYNSDLEPGWKGYLTFKCFDKWKHGKATLYTQLMEHPERPLVEKALGYYFTFKSRELSLDIYEVILNHPDLESAVNALAILSEEGHLYWQRGMRQAGYPSMGYPLAGLKAKGYRPLTTLYKVSTQTVLDILSHPHAIIIATILVKLNKTRLLTQENIDQVFALSKNLPVEKLHELGETNFSTQNALDGIFTELGKAIAIRESLICPKDSISSLRFLATDILLDNNLDGNDLPADINDIVAIVGILNALKSDRHKVSSLTLLAASVVQDACEQQCNHRVIPRR